MTKKLFAFDLDGTLLNSKDELTQVTLDGLKEIQDKGHTICIITGRSWNMMKKYYEQIKPGTPTGVFNGGVITGVEDEDFEMIAHKIKYSVAMDVIEHPLVKANVNNVTVESFGTAFVSNLNSSSAELQRKWTGIEPELFSPEKQFGGIVGILIELKISDVDEASIIANQIKSDFPNLEVSHWLSYYTNVYTIEITSLKSRKDHALKVIADHLGFDMKDTIAFGDGMNDAHMLKAAGLGVSMANANPQVHEWSNDQTHKGNDENGVVDYIFKENLV